MSNLANLYKSEVAPALMSKFGYKSVMQIPKIDKLLILVSAKLKTIIKHWITL